MTFDSLHPLLKRQVKKYLGLQEEIPEHLFNFLKSVNQSYLLYDSNRELVERAMSYLKKTQSYLKRLLFNAH
jgi:hypothetical protein